MNVSILGLISSPYLRFKNEVSSQDLLKSIAILAMIIDHTGLFFFPEFQWIRAIGRISAPIWFFFVGYNYKDCKFLSDKIFYAAIILLIVRCLAENISLTYLNVLFSILICKKILSYYSQSNDINTAELLTLSFLSLMLYFLTNPLFEYGTLGISLAIWGYNHKHEIGNKLTQAIASFILVCLTQIISFNLSPLSSLISIILISLIIYALYNYKPVIFNISGVTKYIINISSRYSLYLYCLHLILFIILSRAIYK